MANCPNWDPLLSIGTAVSHVSLPNSNICIELMVRCDFWCAVAQFIRHFSVFLWVKFIWPPPIFRHVIKCIRVKPLSIFMMCNKKVNEFVFVFIGASIHCLIENEKSKPLTAWRRRRVASNSKTTLCLPMYFTPVLNVVAAVKYWPNVSTENQYSQYLVCVGRPLFFAFLYTIRFERKCTCAKLTASTKVHELPNRQ